MHITDEEIQIATERSRQMSENAIKASKVKIKNNKIKITLVTGVKLSCPLELVGIDIHVYGKEVELLNSETLYFSGNNEYVSLEGLVIDIMKIIPGCTVTHINRP